jgi:hypothetical protein
VKNQIIKTEAVQTRALIPFTVKSGVDEERRLVRGLATEEIKDLAGDVVDFETFKVAALAWRGNIREMHQPIAVGKAIELEFLDAEKKCFVTSYVSKGAEPTWQKVLDGTLCMYSVGINGKRQIEKTAGGEIIKRILVDNMIELSLVDQGMLQTAEFEIVKSVGGNLVATQQLDETPVTAAAAVDDALETAKVVTLTDAGSVLALVKGLATLEGGDPARQLRKAAIIAGVGTNADLLKGMPKAWITKATPTSGVRPETYDIDQALSAIACVEHLLASEAFELNWKGADGAAPTPAEQEQITMLRAALENLIAFLQSEFAEQFQGVEPAADAEGIELVATPRSVKAVINLADALTKALPVMFSAIDPTGKVVLIAKAGARHSKTDMEMIQTMHDTSIALGAGCASGDEKAAIVVDFAKFKAGELPATEFAKKYEIEIAPVASTEAQAGNDLPDVVLQALKDGRFQVFGKDASELVDHGIVALQVLDTKGQPLGERIDIAALETPEDKVERVLTSNGVTDRKVIDAARLAAKSAEAATAAPATATATKAAATVLPAEVTELITKTATALAETKTALNEVQATATAQAATIDELKAEIVKFGEKPRVGGPLTRSGVTAIEKKLGTNGDGSATVDETKAAIDILKATAAACTSEAARMEILSKVLMLEQSSGVTTTRILTPGQSSQAAQQ